MTYRKPIIAALGLIAVAGLAGAWAQQRESNASTDRNADRKQAKVGERAPDFTLLDHTGKRFKLSDYKDKIVVLEWVNQECPWSRKVVPDVQKLTAKFAEKPDVVFLGVESTHHRKPAENDRYVREVKFPYPILMDVDGKVGRLYGARTTPHMYVIAKGKLVYAGAIHNNQRGQTKASDVRNYVDEALTALLAGKKVPLAETTPWGCSVKYRKEKK